MSRGRKKKKKKKTIVVCIREKEGEIYISRCGGYSVDAARVRAPAGVALMSDLPRERA